MHLGAPLVTAYTVVTVGVSLHVRTCRDTPPPHTHTRTHRASVSRKRLGRLCSNLVCGLGSLTKCLPQVMGGVHLHVRTCAPHLHKCSTCCYSVTVGPIALKFAMHLETHHLQLMQPSRVGYLCTCARANRVSVSQERLGRL